MEDLLDQTNDKTTEKSNEILLGAVRFSAAYRELSMTNNPIGHEIYEKIYRSSQTKPANIVDTREQGIALTLNSPFAFFQVSSSVHTLICNVPLY